MNRLVRYYPNTDLRSGHKGLSEKLRRDRIRIENLSQGEMIAFVNRKQTKCKLLAAGGKVIAYYSSDKPIDPRVLMHIPRAMSGSKINFDVAVERMIRKSFPKWFKTSLKLVG